jgi:hypothetical protein
MSATTAEPLAAGTPSIYPSDEQILGIDSGERNAADCSSQAGDVAESVAQLGSEVSQHPEAPDAARIGEASQAADKTEMPEWLTRVSESIPEGAGADAKARLAEMWQRSAELEAFDGAYFGNDPAQRQQFVERMYSQSPAALEAMFEAARALIEREAQSRPRVATQPKSAAAPARGEKQSASEFDAGGYAEFERSTNEAVVAEMNREIGRVMERALPEGIAEGARRRIAEDTLAEVHGLLRSDRQLATQVAETIRGANFDDGARQQVARLIAARARGVLPAAAKRVIGEWTGTVLATHRESASRQEASQSRVDILGGGVPQPVPRKGTSPREINYRQTSDEEILSW